MLTLVLLASHCFSQLKLGASLKVYIFVAIDIYEFICCHISAK